MIVNKYLWKRYHVYLTYVNNKGIREASWKVVKEFPENFFFEQLIVLPPDRDWSLL